jgi:tRNA threonylcarbamoyladenosine biosynthesis protein TsaB
MNSLIIDTSTKYLYIALVKDDVVLSEKIFEGSKNHAGNSVYQIDLLLKEFNLKTSDLDNVYCGYGPGSYTGVRISVTIAKMLASFLDVNLYKVSSLFLAGSGYDNKNVAVMFDARRGNSFCGCYGENFIEDKLRSNEEFLNLVNSYDDLIVVNESNFKVNPLKVIENATKVDDVEAFVPSYLRITEAEYNLRHQNDQKS